MPNSLHHGIPAPRGPLAATGFAAPAPETRVTIVPDLPLVPVRAVVAAALAADKAARSIVWVDLPAEPRDDRESWDAIRGALAAASGSPLAGEPEEAVATLRLALKKPAAARLELGPGVSHELDAGLLALLADAPQLSLVAICSGRRMLEVMGRGEHGGH